VAVKQECADHPLRSIWDRPFTSSLDLDAEKSRTLESGINVFNSLSTAAKIAQEAARMDGKLGSGLACKVEIQLPNEASSDMRMHLDQWQRNKELADLLVVSQAVVKALGNVTMPEVDWMYEQGFEAGTAERPAQGKVMVLPPDHLKCPRCWKYTADKEETPCQRCQHVLDEKGVRHA
jgi:isoleucyl-tRNA synthetase